MLLENFEELSDWELRDIYGGDCSASIRAHRKMLNLTQDELAAKLFVDSHTIRNWEKGATEIKGCDLFRLSQVFDTTIDEL